MHAGQRVVADVEVTVEGQVIGGEREVGARLARADEESAFALTPVTTVWICSLPGTWSPLGP